MTLHVFRIVCAIFAVAFLVLIVLRRSNRHL
jgi:hypothetical protein